MSMTSEEQALKPPKKHYLRYLLLLIILGVAVHLLVPQITTLQKSWSVVKNMVWWAVLLAAIAQILSYIGNGYMLHAIVESNQQKLSVLKGTLIAIASPSIGLVAGGWVGGAAATFGWVKKESRDSNTAILAGTLPAILNNAVLIGVALIGTLYLLLVHDLTNKQLVEFGIILGVLGLLSGVAIAAIRFPGPTIRLAVWLAGHWAKIRKKPYKAEDTVDSVQQFFGAWNSLRKGKWLRPLLGAVINIAFDMLTLFLLFVAAGHPVSPGVLFAGYGLPLILGKMAFMFPGGVGVIEGTMVALYDSLKVPNEISAVVILAYRLLSFWLPVGLGFIAAGYLSGRSGRSTMKLEMKGITHERP
jgi:uncharacterized protein (TIRG00374 family)